MAEKYTNDELAAWFKDKAMQAKTGTARNRLLSASERYSDINNEFVGNVYFFRYDPKHKLTLPLYDKYPLAIVIERYTDGFLGMNLHYLTKTGRGSAISMFTSFHQSKKINQAPTNGRGLTNWELLINYSESLEAAAKKSVHRYLYNNVRSQFIKLNPDEYTKAAQLPIEEWVRKR